MTYNINLERGHKIDAVHLVGRDASGNMCIVAREATGIIANSGQEGRRIVLIKLTGTGITYQNLTADNERWVPVSAIFDRVNMQGFSDPAGNGRDIVYGALNSDGLAGAFTRDVRLGPWS